LRLKMPLWIINSIIRASVAFGDRLIYLVL
jgi:hypothetical protein